MRTSGLMLGMALALSCASLGQFFRVEPESPAVMPPGSTRVTGAYAKAAGIAIQTLLASQTGEPRDGGLPGPGDGVQEDPEAGRDGGMATIRYPPQTIAECFARPEAFDVFVGFDEKARTYIVKVVPIAERCLDGPAKIRDLGASYLLDAVTFEILDSTTLE